MIDFKIGDRILFVCNTTPGPIKKGYRAFGTIVDGPIRSLCRSDDMVYDIRLDYKHVSGHTCGGKTENYHGYTCYESDLTLLSKRHLYVQNKKSVLRSLLISAHKTKESKVKL